jgi:hypothetical protein
MATPKAIVAMMISARVTYTVANASRRRSFCLCGPVERAKP